MNAITNYFFNPKELQVLSPEQSLNNEDQSIPILSGIDSTNQDGVGMSKADPTPGLLKRFVGSQFVKDVASLSPYSGYALGLSAMGLAIVGAIYGYPSATARNLMNSGLFLSFSLMSLFVAREFISDPDRCARRNEKTTHSKSCYFRDEQHVINLINSTENPFSNDSNYIFVKGNPANGIVVFYPQAHLAECDLNQGINKSYLDKILQSQLSIYKDFMIKKPEHIYGESMEPSIAAIFNSIKLHAHSPLTIDFEMTAIAIKNGDELSPKQKELFLRLGGAAFYAILSQSSDFQATLHVTQSEGTSQKIEEIINGKDLVRQLTPDERNLIFHQREAQIEQAIMQTKDIRKGKPAFIVMGAAHDFSMVFSELDSPALYRKITNLE